MPMALGLPEIPRLDEYEPVKDLNNGWKFSHFSTDPHRPYREVAVMVKGNDTMYVDR